MKSRVCGMFIYKREREREERERERGREGEKEKAIICTGVSRGRWSLRYSRRQGRRGYQSEKGKQASNGPFVYYYTLGPI